MSPSGWRQVPYRAVAMLSLLLAPFGCATCGSASLGGLGTVEDSHGPVAEVPVDSVPSGINLPRGNCGADMFLSTDKRCVPLAWHCPPAYYAGGPGDGCDCNCGIADPDCTVDGTSHWCDHYGSTQQVSVCSECNTSAL
jgi:hypothetical protein